MQQMSRLYAAMATKPGRVLAWGALIATTLVLAFLLQAVAASALVVPAQAASPAARQSAATAALADGDDVRAGFLINLSKGTIDATSPP
jgi:hypothetical protein